MARNKQEKKVFHNGGFYNYRPPFNGKKKPYFTLNFLRAIVRPFFKKPKVEFKTEIPDEPVMYVCNHTKIYAPTAIYCISEISECGLTRTLWIISSAGTT